MEFLEKLNTSTDETIHALQEEVGFYQQEQDSLRKKVTELVSENQQLSSKLKDSFHSHLLVVEAREAALHEEESQQVVSLQHQLDVAKEEKQLLSEKWQHCEDELEELRNQLCSFETNEAEQFYRKKILQVKQHYSKAITALQKDVALSKDELSKKEAEGQSTNELLQDFKVTVEALKNELTGRMKETDEYRKRLRVEEEENRVREKLIRQLQEGQQVEQKKQEECSDKINELEEEMVHLKQQISEVEHREAMALHHMRESIQLAESAVLEKDNTLLREKHLQGEVSRLKSTVEQLIEEAGEKTREKVDDVRLQCNNNIQELTKELQRLEMENCEKQQLVDRAVRAKRAAESELEKLYSESQHPEYHPASHALNDVLRQLGLSERTREEVEMKLEKLEIEVKRMANSHRETIERMEEEKKEVLCRLDIQTEDLSRNVTDRQSLHAEVAELQQRLADTERESQLVKLRLEKELRFKEVTHKKKENELSNQLQSRETLHVSATSELRELLAAQQRVSNKLKDELGSVHKEFKSKIEELCHENECLRKNIEDLEADLLQSESETRMMERKTACLEERLQKHLFRCAQNGFSVVNRQTGRNLANR